MKKLQFTININAPVQKVWDTMLGDETYRIWTLPFNPGSYYKGDWSEGSKMLFLGPNPETGEEGGMVSKIAENRLYEYVSIQHIGIVNDGVEDTTSDMAKDWAGNSFENYTFTENNGTTTVTVEIDIVEDMAEEFEEMWPEALQKLKELSEKE